MHIGISVSSRAGQSVWDGGQIQNAVFLAEALRGVPLVRSVSLIDIGNQGAMPPQVDLEALGIALVPLRFAADSLDVIIEMAGQFDDRWLALQRARGKRVIGFSGVHPFADMVEGAVFDRATGFPQAERYDEVWLLPEHAAFANFRSVLHRCPVRIAPCLWHPRFVQGRMEEVTEFGLAYGWKPLADGVGLRVAIFEPNISVSKTSSIPMLACDEAYRAEPRSVQMMHVLNTLHLKDHPTMLYLANSLDLVAQHKACFHGRHDIVGFMCQHADAVVAHQWTHDQNYAYLDSLYGGYPLVHNSPWLRSFGAGYYYEGFDAAEAGCQLRLASTQHDERLPDQRRAAQAVFEAVDPAAQVNIRAYAQLLQGEGVE